VITNTNHLEVRRMRSKKGLSLLEVILAIALLGLISAMLFPALSGQYTMLVHTRSITADLYAAQQQVEQSISEIRQAIQDGTAPVGYTRTGYVLFSGQSNQRTIFGYPDKVEVHAGNAAISLSAVVADTRMPVFDVATATNVVLKMSDANGVRTSAYADTPGLQLTATFDIVDPKNVNLTNISRWYVSRDGFSIPMVTNVEEIENGTIYPRFPEDYVIIKGASSKNLTAITSEYAGKFIIYTVTPASKSGKMGTTVPSNPIFISGLPVISNLRLHLDASMISKEDATAVRTVTTNVGGVDVINRYVKKWNDISGNNNNAIQNTNTRQPELIETQTGDIEASGYNFKTFAKYVAFTGSQSMSITDSSSLDVNNLTVFIVARSTTKTAQKTIVSKLATSSGVTTGWFAGWNTANQMGLTIRNSSGTNTVSGNANDGLDGDWHVLAGSSALSWQMDLGTTAASARTITLTITNNSPVSIGYNGSSDYSTVDIAEIIVYDGILSTVDADDVSIYLMNKYEPEPPEVIIYALKPINDTCILGEPYILPGRIPAYMSNGTMQNVDVVWSPTTIDTSTPGLKVSTAVSVANPEKTTTAKIDVAGIDSLDDMDVSVEQYLPYTLPTTVTAHLTNGAVKHVAVTWDNNNVDTSVLGTVSRTGTAVIDPTKTMTLTITIIPRSVTGVTVNPTSVTINKGSTVALTATVLPVVANNRNVTWSSSDPSVATVNSVGLVSGVAGGNATITVTTEDGGFTATCDVTVNVPCTGVTLIPSSVTISKGSTYTLMWTVAPSDVSNANVTWSSSNTSIATISGGVITAVAKGTATITVRTVDGGFTSTCAVTVNVACTGVTLNQSSITVNKGSTYTLIATVLPADVSNASVTWSSSNTSIATVNNGVVTAVAKGAATITVRTVDGGYTATCAVTVNVPCTGVTLAPSSVTFNKGSTYTLMWTVAPADASNTNVTWSSSNTSIATVNNGVVTGVAKGTATITVRTVDGGFTATSTMTVNVPCTGVTLNQSSITINRGSTYTLIATVLPADVSNASVTWSSSNTGIATVNNGVVTAVAKGSATITVRTVDGGFTANCTVTVNVPCTGVNLTPATITINKNTTTTLTATVSPADASNISVTWSSSNTGIATVNNGVVTAVAKGTATITVRTVDGGFTDTCVVTVNVPCTGVSLNPTSVTIGRGSTSTLTATVAPADVSNASVTWSSSNTSIATVNSSGVVTAVAKGTATITVRTVDGGFTATCAVTVNVRVSGVTLNTNSVTIEQDATPTYTLTATVTPADADNLSITWSSSNASVASVSNGVVTAESGGTAIITVTTADGGYTATCTVTVPLRCLSVSSGLSNRFTLTMNKSIQSAAFNPTVSGTSITISGTQVTCSRTSNFTSGTNYSVRVTATDGTIRTITVSRSGTTWTIVSQ
jgi:uncharacterized protein YjdB/type II secretory pathway pseudopilin PulG